MLDANLCARKPRKMFCTMKTLADQVQEFMALKGWNSQQLADEVGTDRQSVENIWRKGTKMPKYIQALAKVMNTTTDALLAGQWSPDLVVRNPDGSLMAIQIKQPPPQTGGVAQVMSHAVGEDVTIPQFDTGGRMGQMGLVLRDQPGLIHSWRVSTEWLHKNVRQATSAANLCIVTGFGDSMRPMFNPGDPLLVDRGVTSVEYDAIYFFRVDGEGFIKRLQRIPGQGLLAISENTAYRDWTITNKMEFEVLGRVLKVWRSEEY